MPEARKPKSLPAREIQALVRDLLEDNFDVDTLLQALGFLAQAPDRPKAAEGCIQAFAKALAEHEPGPELAQKLSRAATFLVMFVGRNRIAELLSKACRKAKAPTLRVNLAIMAEAVGVPADELPQADETLVAEHLSQTPGPAEIDEQGAWELIGLLLAVPSASRPGMLQEWLSRGEATPEGLQALRLALLAPLDAATRQVIETALEQSAGAPERPSGKRAGEKRLPLPPDWPFLAAHASVPDGNGLQFLTLVRRRPDGKVAAVAIQLGDRFGILDAFGSPCTEKRFIQDILGLAGEMTPSVEVPLDYALDRLAAAFEIHEAYGFPLPFAFQAWRPLLAGWECSRKLDFAALATPWREASLLPQTDRLLDDNAPWYLEEDTSFLEDARERQRWQARLYHAAYLYRQAKQNRLARLAATAGWAIGPDSGVPLEKQPFFQAMIAEHEEGFPEEVAALGQAGGLPELDRMMAELLRAIEREGLETPDEINAYLEGIKSLDDLAALPSASPSDRAQDLVFEAWEATGARRAKLAREALALWPDCADAYVILAQEAKTPQEALALYQAGVEAGTRALGPATFQRDRGHFWGLLETRPYMRARAGLAETLWALGRREEAVAHLEEMLALNPGDNQGLRYRLLGWLLTTNAPEPLARLFERYPDDGSAFWGYGRALVSFQAEGDTAESRRALQQAGKDNPFVPAYLTGRSPMPRQLPPYYGFGDEAEAILCAAEQGEAWRATEGALAWLSAQAGQAPPPRPARPKAPGRRKG